MATEPQVSPEGPRSSSIEDLLVEFLDRSESEGPGVLDELCGRAPDSAETLRARVAALDRAGLLPSTAADRSPERLGEFRILERVGGGGMGVVHRAVEESLGRVVALKVLRAEHLWFAGARERFRREAEAVARLAHPAIVPLYSFGEADGVPYLAMEFVRGASLGRIVALLRTREPASLSGADLLRALAACLGPGPGPRGDPLGLYAGSWSDACARIGAAVAGALEHAHERGVLHRDLKPSNVMLAEDGRVLLVDFGLAAREGADRLTRTGSQLGSLPYMAPEQVDGRTDDVGARTDVYGLGVTLYELLALRLPYDSASTHEIVRRVAAGDASPLRTANARVSRDLQTVIATAMDPRPERRYESAAAFARDLGNVVERRPIEARHSGPLRRAWRWTERHPAGAAAIALAVLVFVGGPIGFAIQQRQAFDDLTLEVGRTARANAALESALRRAETNFTQALDAVALLTRVGEEGLADVPAAEEARRELLEGALTFHSALAAQRRGDPALAAELARTELRVGEILAALGRHGEAELVFASVEQVAAATPPVVDEARESFLAPNAALLRGRSLEVLGRREEAVQHYESVIARLERFEVAGGPVEAREMLLDAWTGLQNLRTSAGDEEGARTAHETRARICDALYREFPGEPKYGVEVAECFVARVLQETNYRITGARTESGRENHANVLEFADRVLAGLRARAPARPGDEELLARTQAVRGQMLSGLKRMEESAVAWRECVDLRRAAVERHPGVPRHARALSTALATLGAVQSASDDLPGALVTYAEAIAVREETATDDTKQRAGTGIVRLNRAQVLIRLGRHDEFEAASAVALGELRGHLAVEPLEPFLLDRVETAVQLRARHFLDRGQADLALAELDALPQVSPRSRLAVARLWARASTLAGEGDVERCRERAFALLATAIGGPLAHEHLDTRDFDTLRGDPRFVAADRRLRP